MLNSIQCCCGSTLEMRLKGIGTLYASFGGMREGFCSLMGYCKWVHSESGYGWDFDGLVVVKGKREKIEMGFGLEGVFGGLGEGEQEVVANWNGEKGHCFLSPSDEVQICSSEAFI